MAGLAGSTGATDGQGAAARFNTPQDIALDSFNNLYVSDTQNNSIRKITSTGVVKTVVGQAEVKGTNNDTGDLALFNTPTGLTVDGSENLYVADKQNHSIRKITPTGVVTTFTGQPGTSGATNGNTTTATFYGPSNLILDSSGNFYISDSNNHMIRKITAGGAVTTLAGQVASGSTDATGAAASFHGPAGITIDSAGNLFVADFHNHTIRKITPAGAVTTFAGLAGASGSTDATGAAARFYYPNGLTIDSSDNLYVADYYNYTIRKITPGGVVTTLAGQALTSGTIDATGTAARFAGPYAITIDPSNNLYVAEYRSSTIRKITPAGVVTTLAGMANVAGLKEGTLPGVISRPRSIVYVNGKLYVTSYNGILAIIL